jgi:hypothetical protein
MKPNVDRQGTSVLVPLHASVESAGNRTPHNGASEAVEMTEMFFFFSSFSFFFFFFFFFWHGRYKKQATFVGSESASAGTRAGSC